MKPFFSIRVAVNRWDADEWVAQNEASLRLAVARQAERQKEDNGSDADCQDEIEISDTLTEAIRWTFQKSSSGLDESATYLVQQIFSACENRDAALEDFLEAEVECGDADFGDMIRRIAKKCEEANI
jgi:hypothetical protein